MRSSYSKIWGAGVVAGLATLVLAALILPQSFFLTALSDIVQCVLLFSGAASLLVRAFHSNGRLRRFWALMAGGISLWFSYQLFWTYYEVYLRAEVPDLCAADIILFLHLVPLTAALALRPHASPDEYSARLRRLDFALLMVWWAYLYILIVIPWQYVVANISVYNENLNSLYLIEKLAFLIALFFAWRGSKSVWKLLYANLFGASLTYSASSYIANWALNRHAYYSGSFYDIPLAISMAWISGIGLWPQIPASPAPARSPSTSLGVWLARMGMIATFSLPLFAAWALLDGPIPLAIRSFRLILTLSASLLMGGMVFARQRLLDRELLRLLKQSRDSIANLKHLETQIVESEKLASIGQLVGGAAHELNNPIAAMLGYSELLSGTSLSPEQKVWADKIGSQVRRTKALVASLLSFARQGPSTMVPLDLNALLRTAIKLSQPQCEALAVDVGTHLTAEMMLVRGDSNQLLQVCLQALNDGLHVAATGGNRSLKISTRHQEGIATIDICDIRVVNPSPASSPAACAHAGAVNPPSEFEHGACETIVRQHHGRMFWAQDADSELCVRIELPAILASPEPSPADASAALLRPQPSA